MGCREIPLDREFQKFWNDVINGENRLRKNWFYKFGYKYFEQEDPRKRPTRDDDHRVSIMKKAYTDPRRASPRGEGLMLIPETSADVIPWPGAATSGTSTLLRVADPPLIMNTVDSDSRALLYSGISHDGEGRDQYLRYRLRLDPEDKYKFPVSQNWDYGWKFKGNPDMHTGPDHGKCCVRHQTFRPSNC